MGDVRRRRVLVTGAGGFIGANLVRALLEGGARVVALVRPEGSVGRLAGLEDDVEIVGVDLRAPESLHSVVAGVRPELAVNLAAVTGHPQTPGERLAHLEVSVLGTARLVEALAVAGCRRLVHIGSSLEYGPSSDPMSEDDRLRPTVPRGAAKAAESIVCLVWAGALGVPALVLRPFSVYGPWEHESRLVPTALRATIDGTELRLTEPDVVRDFVYVGDVVEAIVRALEAPDGVDGEIVNVGSGVQTTVEELVATIGRVVGRETHVRHGAYPVLAHDSRTWVADVERARRLLGWESSTPLEEGLRRTQAWLEAQGGRASA